MVTIATFSKPEEAQMLRLRLEAGGVPAYVQDENMVQTNWLVSNAIGGVRVQIAEDDVEEARAILQDPGCESEPAEMPACPKCRSMNTAPDTLPRRLSFLSLLVAGFPFLFSKTRWRCAKCNAVWDERNKESSR